MFAKKKERGFRDNSEGKKLQERQVQSLGWQDRLEEGMTTRSSIVGWNILWSEEPNGLQYKGHKESDVTEQLSTRRQCLREGKKIRD